MNPKIMKLRGELEKNKGKISDLQGRNRELEKQIRELEDTDIIGMVRENGMTMEQFPKPISRRCIISSAQFSIMRFDSMISTQIRQPEPGIWATKSERKCCSGQRRSI